MTPPGKEKLMSSLPQNDTELTPYPMELTASVRALCAENYFGFCPKCFSPGIWHSTDRKTSWNACDTCRVVWTWNSIFSFPVEWFKEEGKKDPETHFAGNKALLATYDDARAWWDALSKKYGEEIRRTEGEEDLGNERIS